MSPMRMKRRGMGGWTMSDCARWSGLGLVLVVALTTLVARGNAGADDTVAEIPDSE